MPNPSGSNQFQPEPAYGAVQRMTQLTREAPISGAPVAAHALDTPRRGRRQAARGGQGQPEVQAPPPVPPPPPVGPQQIQAQVWQQVAADPGASPLVKMYAQRAQSGT